MYEWAWSGLKWLGWLFAGILEVVLIVGGLGSFAAWALGWVTLPTALAALALGVAVWNSVRLDVGKHHRLDLEARIERAEQNTAGVGHFALQNALRAKRGPTRPKEPTQ